MTDPRLLEPTPYHSAVPLAKSANFVTLHSSDNSNFAHPGRRWPHAFRCAGTGAAKIFAFITPGERMQQMFGRLAELTQRHGTMLDRALVAEVARDYGIVAAVPA